MKVISHFLLDAEVFEKSSIFYLYSGHRINEFGAKNKPETTLYLFLPVKDDKYRLYLLINYDANNFHFITDPNLYDEGDVSSYQRLSRDVFLNQDFDYQKIKGHVEYAGDPMDPPKIEVEQVSSIMMHAAVILTRVKENEYISPTSQWNYRTLSAGSNRVQI